MSKISSIKLMYFGLLIFGIIVFIIGLLCVFYKEYQTAWSPTGWIPLGWGYPYRDVGVILTIGGIVLTTLGFILGFILPKREDK